MSTKPNGKSIISSSDGNGESKTGSNPVQSTVVKANGKTHVSSDDNRELMLFNEVSLGPQETNLRFRLVHFWEARNPLQKTLIGLEMLLIDEQETVIQGFVPPGRIKKFMPHMRQGGLVSTLSPASTDPETKRCSGLLLTA
ncbi:BnaAnng30040D [Brassica napus]|uniref:BnaAnng30040D protein n=1 Tax=Brassica napus TaxID=3708 RepID=A0A078JRB6_BRANA|nr:BnaAnng30040D [Brassica napus]